MINEQLAGRQELAVGQTLNLTVADKALSLPVLAIYPDYGRPAGEVLLNAELLPTAFKPGFESLSINPGNLDMATVVSGLQRVCRWRR